MMKKDLVGKRLLVLGATPLEASLIRRAQERGAFVISTDSNVDRLLSPSKNIANEAWDISWSDIDSMEEQCRINHVDGVLAGYSEFRVENLIKLCNRLDYPCYITQQQLDITRDKALFKNACLENGVPTVHAYSSVEEVNSFPVIVKPVDRAGSIGISVASDREQLIAAYEYAMECSIKKEVVIEDFISDGVKFDITYFLSNGECVASIDCDTINAKDNGVERVVQSAWLLPSRYHDPFMKKVDDSLKRMMKSLGMKEGIVFFSGFAIERNNAVTFCFFETGYRLGGGQMYNYFDALYGINPQDLLINYSLGLPTHNVFHYISPESTSKKYVILNYYAKKGIVSQIEGLSEISKNDDCVNALEMGYVGEKCDEDKAILSKMAMVHFVSNSVLKLSKDISDSNAIIRVLDQNGSDMIYDRINADIVNTWWY